MLWLITCSLFTRAKLRKLDCAHELCTKINQKIWHVCSEISNGIILIDNGYEFEPEIPTTTPSAPLPTGSTGKSENSKAIGIELRK